MDNIGICLASYNGEKYITEQLDSLVSQTFENFVCYIQDDGSTDSTVEVIKDFIKKREECNDFRFKLVSVGRHQGVAKNFLSLLKCTKENYVMFCDQDDVWLNNKIELSYNRIKQIENENGKDCPIMVFTDLYVVDSKLNKIRDSVYGNESNLNPYERNYKILMRTNNNFGNTQIFNRKLVDIVNAITCELPFLCIHDSLITVIASLIGKIDYLPISTILYRQHGSNSIGFIQKKQNPIKLYVKRCFKTIKMILSQDKRWGCEGIIEYAQMLVTLPMLPKEEEVILKELVELKSKNKFYRIKFYKKNGFYHGIRLLWA